MNGQRASKWYRWLWLSPLLTIPTLAAILLQDPGWELICGGTRAGCDWRAAETVSGLIAVLVSALWHLVLLMPALDKEHPFVRWHGRQALLLAGVRTAVPLAFTLAFGLDDEMLLSVPILIAIWLGGTLWGQRQAKRGDCSLMLWSGHGALLDALPAEPSAEEGPAPDAEDDLLVEIIRSSRDPEERRRALGKLAGRGMVEWF